MGDKPNIASDLTRLDWFTIQRGVIDYAKSVEDNSIGDLATQTLNKINVIINNLGPAKTKALWVMWANEPNNSTRKVMVFDYDKLNGIQGLAMAFRINVYENVRQEVMNYFPAWILTDHEEYENTMLLDLEERSS